LGLLIRVYPPLSNDFLVNFDSIYHARIGQTVADTGWVPEWDYVAGGRPHLYPPAYHLVLGYLSIALGVAVIDLIGFVLPFVSALLVVPVFFLIRKFRDEKYALLGAALVAVNPIVIAQSYDSPQLFGLFLFPFLVYNFLKGDYLKAAIFFALSMFFNYFVSLTIGVVLLAYVLLKLKKGENRPLIIALLTLAIGIGLVSPWLLIAADRAGQCFDPTTAVAGINAPGLIYLLIMVPFMLFVSVGLMYWLERKKKDDYTLFWKVAFMVGSIGFIVSLFMPELHPYDQLLLFGFGIVFLLPELKLKKRDLAIVFSLMLLASAIQISLVKPALSEGDLAAVRWVDENVEEGNILANTEISGAINTVTMNPDIHTEFDFFLECIPDSRRWTIMNSALATDDIASAKKALDEYAVDYVIVGARDEWNYGFNIDKFEQLGDRVYVSGGTKIYEV
jgi:hypothetical protein